MPVTVINVSRCIVAGGYVDWQTMGPVDEAVAVYESKDLTIIGTRLVGTYAVHFLPGSNYQLYDDDGRLLLEYNVNDYNVALEVASSLILTERLK
jgi:hypothetical protein